MFGNVIVFLFSIIRTECHALRHTSRGISNQIKSTPQAKAATAPGRRASLARPSFPAYLAASPCPSRSSIQESPPMLLPRTRNLISAMTSGGAQPLRPCMPGSPPCHRKARLGLRRAQSLRGRIVSARRAPFGRKECCRV